MKAVLYVHAPFTLSILPGVHGCAIKTSYFLINLMIKITRQEPITPPMIFPMMPEMRKLPASQLKSAPPTIPMITFIYQGKDVFMSIPAIQPQTPAITSEMINSIIVNSFSIRQSG